MNSIKKGKKFELWVAHLLTHYFQIPFSRVPMSGAFATQHKNNNPIFEGDVFTNNKKWNEHFNVVIECKRIKHLSKKKNVLTLSIVKKWVEQCVRESKGKPSWLIFKQDYKPAQIISLSPHGEVIAYGDLIIFLKEKQNEWLEVIKK